MTPHAIIAAAGGINEVARRLPEYVRPGEKPPSRHTISNWRYLPRIPARWYGAFCDMTRLDLPKSAFTFKGEGK